MAPLAMGWLSCAMETLSAGRNTMAGMPRRGAAQYADSAADVSPVDAQATACTLSGFILRSRLTCVTSAAR